MKLSNTVIGINNPIQLFGQVASKEQFNNWIKDIHQIQKEYQAEMTWSGEELNGTKLINAIKSRTSVLASRHNIQTIYLEEVNEQGERVLIEHGYQVPISSVENSVYENLTQHIIKKDEDIKKVLDFIFCFNQLEKIQKIILYYSLFKKEGGTKISQMRLDGELKYATRTVYRRREEGIERLIKKLNVVDYLKAKEKEEFKHANHQ